MCKYKYNCKYIYIQCMYIHEYIYCIPVAEEDEGVFIYLSVYLSIYLYVRLYIVCVDT